MEDEDRSLSIEQIKELGIEVTSDFKDDSQVVEKVELKIKKRRNRGLSKDIKNLVASNPLLSSKEVFDMLKANSYKGDRPITLNTVMVTMSVLKKKSL